MIRFLLGAASRVGLRMSLVVIAGLAVGCSSDDVATLPTSGSGAPSGPAAPEPSAAADTGDVGVPECDAYLRQMAACIAKAPEAERANRTTALEATRGAWRAQAKSTESKANLPGTCHAAAEALKATPCP